MLRLLLTTNTQGHTSDVSDWSTDPTPTATQTVEGNSALMSRTNNRLRQATFATRHAIPKHDKRATPGLFCDLVNQQLD